MTKEKLMEWLDGELEKRFQGHWKPKEVTTPRLPGYSRDCIDFYRVYVRVAHTDGVDWLIPCFYTIRQLSWLLKNGHELFLNSERTREYEIDVRKETKS